MLTYVLSADGSPLMPTYNIRKVRQMLKNGRAVIAGHKPGFTIRLTCKLPEQDMPHIQKVEACEDTGDHHIGLSVKSAKHEFAHHQYDLLPDEKQRHDACRKYRRTRRNRLRHRKPRFDNRKKPEGWFAPSVENKARQHVLLIKSYMSVIPISSITLETARFDTQLLESQQAGKKPPEGKDYQKGIRYMRANTREAVFTRDGYKCRICGKGVSDGAVLHVHHALFWKGDHTDRISGLLTVCSDCHTPADHKPGGKLYGLTPEIRSMAGAAFMNEIRSHILDLFREAFPGVEIHVTNGAKTKCSRSERNLPKTHANDAYCMGEFRPKHRAKEQVFVKRRRNNRVLSKFYDAKVIDIRDGKKKSGSQLGTNRTNRREPRASAKNERIYRGQKVSKGRVSVRKQRYAFQHGDIVLYHGRPEPISGVQNNGAYIRLMRRTADGKYITLSAKTAVVIKHSGGWLPVERTT